MKRGLMLTYKQIRLCYGENLILKFTSQVVSIKKLLQTYQKLGRPRLLMNLVDIFQILTWTWIQRIAWLLSFQLI
jgi:hypothetical protein